MVLVTGSLEGGGAERVMADMANYWAGAQWRVTLATWRGMETQDFYTLDPRIKRVWLDVEAPDTFIAAKLRSNLRRVRKLRRLLVDARPDAVLSFINTSNVLTILAGVGLGARIVVSERVQPATDNTLPFEWKALRRALYRLADEVVVQTRDAAPWVERNCRKMAHVVPNPLRSLPSIALEREPLIVAVGRLVQQKGFDVLLKAFAKIAVEFEEWTVAIIGDGSDREALVQLRDNLGLCERVQFIGRVRGVESWMARAGLVVQPSRFEGFPNVVLEAMGMGAAVISTDCRSGPSDLIENHVNGRLVPVDDISALASVMAELMRRPDVRATMGENALRVRQRFHQDSIMARWEALLLRGVPTCQEAVDSRG